MGKTGIGWTNSSWNPYTWNCNKVSPGCQNCYMFAMSRKLKALDATGAPRMREAAWRELDHLEPGPVFVNSMSDTYHESVPAAWIHRIHNAARSRPQFVFLLLTKRIERAAALAPFLDWPPNLWIGTTVESPAYSWRLDYLRRIASAAGRFVSFEPLLDAVSPDLTGIDWVIVGGESGAQRRYFSQDWVVKVHHAAALAHIPFFYKQGSAYAPGQDRLLYGHEYSEVPAAWNWTPEHAISQNTAVQMELFAGMGG